MPHRVPGSAEGPGGALRSLLRTFALALLLLAPTAGAQQPVPSLQGRITDLTATLSATQRATLESTLTDFERRKGAQVAVLIVASTAPESIEQYAVRVEESWKLGRKGVDDGVLLVVAKDDRRLRIEVGYGLEGVIPDAIGKRIIEQDITPRFRQGDFYGGIEAGTRRIIGLIDGETLPAPDISATNGGSERNGNFVAEHLIFVAVILILVTGALRALLGRALGSAASGVLAFLIGWFTAGLLVALVLAIFASVMTLLGGLSAGTGRGGGGFGSGGFGGGGGGFSGGGGGFSGGGGGSGGGGASGSW